MECRCDSPVLRLRLLQARDRKLLAKDVVLDQDAETAGCGHQNDEEDTVSKTAAVIFAKLDLAGCRFAFGLEGLEGAHEANLLLRRVARERGYAAEPGILQGSAVDYVAHRGRCDAGKRKVEGRRQRVVRRASVE